MANVFFNATHVAFRASGSDYLRQDGNFEGLVVVFAHQIEGDDWEDVPRRRASLPTHQLLSKPESSRKLLSLKKGNKHRDSTVTQTDRLIFFFYPFWRFRQGN